MKATEMKLAKRNKLGRFGLLSGLVLGIAISLTPAQAMDDSKSAAGKLEGTWLTQVAIRDCQSGAILRSFSAINTFNSGETMVDTTTGVSPSLRSPGLGKWEQTGPQTYTAISLALLFNPAGVWIGSQKLTHTITVSGDENVFTSTSQVFDTSGTVLSTGCATAAGTRM